MGKIISLGKYLPEKLKHQYVVPSSSTNRGLGQYCMVFPPSNLIAARGDTPTVLQY